MSSFPAKMKKKLDVLVPEIIFTDDTGINHLMNRKIALF
jgi:hypothetical protein